MRPASAVRIKSYFASSVEQAIAQARLELGPDALLLNTRKTAESDGTPRYEVTMGLPGEVGKAIQPRLTAPAVPKAGALPAASPATIPATGRPVNEVMAGLSAIHEQIAEMQALLSQQSKARTLKSRLVPELAQLHQSLLEAQMDPGLSLDIVGKLEGILATDAFFREAALGQSGTRNRWKNLPSDPGVVQAILLQELERRVRFSAVLGVQGGTRGAVAVLVGPTGGGKTTSLVKLAARDSALPVRLISLDSERPGSMQQLQAMTREPAIRHSFLKAFESLPAIIADLRGKECLLIDTPPMMAANAAGSERLAKILQNCPELDVHLVMPAYMSGIDFKNSIERYRAFHPAKLLVTKLDEAQTFGTAFSMAAQSGLALSFLADGPRLPQDLHPATADTVLSMMGEWTRADAHHAA